jgi:GH24 family phage-related lysozyme (muramidase)
MARNSGQVNVGSIQTSGKELSRLLLNASNRFGAQAENETKNKQLLEDKAESNRRFELNQTRLLNNEAESKRRFNLGQAQLTERNALKQEKADGLKAGNAFFANANEGRNPPLKEDDYDTPFQKVFSTQKGKWDTHEGQYRKYLLSGNPEDLDSVIAGILPGKGVDKQKRSELQNRRRTNIQIVRKAAQNAGSSDERKAIEDRAILDIFGGRRAALNKDIAEGSFLTNKQKVNALIKYVPESYSNNYDVSTMQRNLLSTMSGNTKQDLQKSEKDRVNQVNQERKSIYDADKLRYKAQVAQRKGSKDWKSLGKLVERDLGYHDNKDKNGIIDYMVEQGVPHDRIKYAVERLVETSIFGTESIPDADSPEVLEAVSLIVSNMKDEGIAIGSKIKPVKGYTTEVAGDLNQIQKRMFQNSGTRSTSAIQLQSGWDKYKEQRTELVPPAVSAVPPVVPVEDSTSVQQRLPVAQSTNAALARPYDPVKGTTNNVGTFLQNVSSIPEKYNEFASKNNANFRSVGANKSLLERGIVGESDKFTGNERMVASSIRAGLEKGMPVESFTEDEQKVLNKMRNVEGSIRIGKEILNRQNSGTSANNNSTLPEEVGQTESGTRLRENQLGRYTSEAMNRDTVDSQSNAYAVINRGKKKSQMAKHPNPIIKHGQDAVKAVEKVEGKLNPLEKMIVMDEGYSNDVYLDGNGQTTTGVGQTKEFMDVPFKKAINDKIAVSKNMVDDFDILPTNVQYSVVQAVYRGDAKKDYNWIKHINEGEFKKASEEILDHKEYKKLKSDGVNNSITRRIERASKALKDYGTSK